MLLHLRVGEALGPIHAERLQHLGDGLGVGVLHGRPAAPRPPGTPGSESSSYRGEGKRASRRAGGATRSDRGLRRLAAVFSNGHAGPEPGERRCETAGLGFC